MAQSRYVQVRNPKTKTWVKIDRQKGRICKTSKTKFSGVPVASKKRNKMN